MAANVTGMRVEGTTVAGAATKRTGAHWLRIGASGGVAAILVALLIVVAAIHDRQVSHPATATSERTVVTSMETRFVENNTTSLPNATSVERQAVVASGAQQYLAVNTSWLPATDTIAASTGASSGQLRFIEANTLFLPAGSPYPYAEDLTPALGQRR